MKKSSKMSIILLVLILVIIGVVVIRPKQTKDKNEIEGTETNVNIEENNVKILENGAKLNTSSKLNEDKNIGQVAIKNIQVMYKDGVTNLLATIENNEDKDLPETKVTITFIDELGNEIYKMQGLIEPTKVGETCELNCSITADFSNAYDIKIEKN